MTSKPRNGWNLWDRHFELRKLRERQRDKDRERDRDTQRGKTTGEGKRRRGNRCVNWNGMFIIKQ